MVDARRAKLALDLSSGNTNATMPYPASNFPQDFALLREIDTPEWDPPWNASPLVNLDGMIIRLPVHRFENRLLLYFCTKYGQESGPEYHQEFLAIFNYIRDYQFQLIQDGMMRRMGDHLELTTQFVNFFLSSPDLQDWK